MTFLFERSRSFSIDILDFQMPMVPNVYQLNKRHFPCTLPKFPYLKLKSFDSSCFWMKSLLSSQCLFLYEPLVFWFKIPWFAAWILPQPPPSTAPPSLQPKVVQRRQSRRHWSSRGTAWPGWPKTWWPRFQRPPAEPPKSIGLYLLGSS